MAVAKFRKVYGKNGSGRFVVTEYSMCCGYSPPHEALPESEALPAYEVYKYPEYKVFAFMSGWLKFSSTEEAVCADHE